TQSVRGPTLEVFVMPPLAPERASDLVRRTIPSLPDAVVGHVVELAEGRPGRVRSIVARLTGAPGVAPEDVDRLLEEASPVTGRADLEQLLDRGHFDAAAEVLARFEDDDSAEIAIARSRLYTNRGDAPRALAELERVEDQIPADPAHELTAAFRLARTRAHLR